MSSITWCLLAFLLAYLCLPCGIGPRLFTPGRAGTPEREAIVRLGQWMKGSCDSAMHLTEQREGQREASHIGSTMMHEG